MQGNHSELRVFSFILLGFISGAATYFTFRFALTFSLYLNIGIGGGIILITAFISQLPKEFPQGHRKSMIWQALKNSFRFAAPFFLSYLLGLGLFFSIGW